MNYKKKIFLFILTFIFLFPISLVSQELANYKLLPSPQKFEIRGISSLNVNNISNEPDKRYISVLRKLNSVEYYGMTTDLGVRYEF